MPNHDSPTRQALLSAELPYFRVPRDDWELMLARLHQLGANTVSTAVPWAWHEPRAGALDFAGATHPQRDLLGFLQLCATLGFQVILKPGPFVEAGLLGGGAPAWLLHAHPEIHALRPDGQPWRDAVGAQGVCTLHPAYLAAARGWFSAFSAATLALQYPAGLVVALQAGCPPPGDTGARVWLDYNPYLVDEVWPRWLREHRDQPPQELPRVWEPPGDIEELRRAVDLAAFAGWCRATVMATITGWLRDDGWTIPVCHEPEAAASYAMPEYHPHTLSFEEYVDHAFWRARLLGQRSKRTPSCIPALSAAQDFSVAAVFVGGLEVVNLAAAVQIHPDNAVLGAWPRWGMDAPIRPDGSLRLRFWNAKTLFMLFGAAGADFAAARAPAALALGYSQVPEHVAVWGVESTHPSLGAVVAGCDHLQRSRTLAQRLVRAGVDFDLLDLDTATPEELARYALVVTPVAAVLARATQAKLANCANLALVGQAHTRYDERLHACTILDERAIAIAVSEDAGPPEAERALITAPVRLPDDIGGAQLAELVEERGGMARSAWADTVDVDVSVRYGQEQIYLFVANRRTERYSGTLVYRDAEGTLQHLHLAIGAWRAGVLALRNGEVTGVAIGGDGSQEGWIVRGMHSSITFYGGVGLMAPCGEGLILSAAQSGRFQIRRESGWHGTLAFRLLVSGALLPATPQIEGEHIVVPYVSEDEHGQTDLYGLLPEGSDLPHALREYTSALLRSRAAATRHAGALASAPFGDSPELAVGRAVCAAAAQGLSQLASTLDALAARPYTLDEYGAAWRDADESSRTLVVTLTRALAHARGAHLAGTLEQAPYMELEDALSRLLGIIARSRLANDRE